MANNYIDYTTTQGDTFDMLALRAYESEFMSHIIIQANPQYADILVFDSGVNLKIPIISRKAASVLPPWKR